MTSEPIFRHGCTSYHPWWPSNLQGHFLCSKFCWSRKTQNVVGFVAVFEIIFSWPERCGISKILAPAATRSESCDLIHPVWPTPSLGTYPLCGRWKLVEVFSHGVHLASDTSQHSINVKNHKKHDKPTFWILDWACWNHFRFKKSLRRPQPRSMVKFQRLRSRDLLKTFKIYPLVI